MALAAVGQAVCAVWLDQLCADYCASFLPTLDEGQYLTPAFSPGYGDWDLAAQRQVLDLLQAPKRIGLTLTAGGMLVPEKSITALVGLSDRRRSPAGRSVCDAKRKTVPSAALRRRRTKAQSNLEKK